MVEHLDVQSRYDKTGDKETRIISLSGGIHKGDIIEIKYWLPKALKSLVKKVKL